MSTPFRKPGILDLVSKTAKGKHNDFRYYDIYIMSSV